MSGFDLSKYSQPVDTRGRSKWVVQIWWLVQSTLFAWSPQFLYPWRAFLLKLFGAKIGPGFKIRSSAKVVYPWKFRAGDNAWVGDEVTIYNLADITVGENTVISQRCYICSGSHDYTRESFDLKLGPVVIGSSVWLASDVFVAPNVSIADEAVVSLRSTVLKSILESGVYVGTPVKKIKDRQWAGN